MSSEAFVEGDDDDAGVAPDLDDHPGPAHVDEVLREPPARAGVLDVVLV